MGIEETLKLLNKGRFFRIIKNDKNVYRLRVEEGRARIAYYFSIPIRARNDELLELKWKIESGAYFFQGINAKVEATKNWLAITNEETSLKITFSGEVELEPTYNGVLVRSGEQEINMHIETKTIGDIKATEDCFAVIKNQTPYFSVSGIMGVSKTRNVPLIIKGEQKSYGFDLKIGGREKIEEMLFEINLYASKSIFDTTIKEWEREENNSFGGMAFLSDGNKKERLYSRFNMECFKDIDLKKIEVATLCVPAYTKEGGKVQIRNIREPWCSFGLNWAKSQTEGKIIDEKEVKNGYVQLDVTKSIKEQLHLKTASSYGVVLSNPNKDTVIVSTGDNYYRPQILKIKYKNKE